MGDYFNFEAALGDLRATIANIRSLQQGMKSSAADFTSPIYEQAQDLEGPIHALEGLRDEIIEHLTVYPCYNCGRPIISGETVAVIRSGEVQEDGGIMGERNERICCGKCARNLPG